MSGNETVLTWAHDVDINNITAVRDQIDSALATPDLAKLVVDLADLTFIDSLGLGLLVYAHNECQAAHASFVVRHVPPFTRQLLTHTGLDQTFKLE